MYISHQKRDHPILQSSQTIEAFPSTNIFLQTSIVGEAQLIGEGFYMYESSSFRGIQLGKGIVILHL